MKICSRLASRRAGVLALGAVVVLVSAGTASAQQADPFKSISFAPAAASTNASAAEPQAGAAPAEPGYVTFFKSTELGGLADIYYMYNSTKTPAAFRAFDVSHNSFTVSMAEVWLAKAPDMDSPVGFKV